MSVFRSMLDQFMVTLWKFSSKPSNEAIPAILRLPPEILLEVLCYLDIVPILCLSVTCRTLCARIGSRIWDEVNSEKLRLDRSRFLHIQSQNQPSYWFCLDCEKLHPLEKFPYWRFKGSRFRFIDEYLEKDYPQVSSYWDDDKKHQCEHEDISARCGKVHFKSMPHGMIASYLRTYLIPRLKILSQNPESLPKLKWWGQKFLSHSSPDRTYWQRCLGTPSYLAETRIRTQIFGSTSVVLQLYKYRVAQAIDILEISLVMCDHHYIFPGLHLDRALADAHQELRDLVPTGLSEEVPYELGDEPALQLPVDNLELKGTGGVVCSKCGTEMYWTKISGLEFGKPPLGVSPFMVITIVQRYDISGAEPRLMPKDRGTHVEDQIGEWVWIQVGRAMGVRFRWQVGAPIWRHTPMILDQP